MKNKSGAMVLTLIEKIKKNAHYFGEVINTEVGDGNCTYANTALQSGDNAGEYLVIVIKKEKAIKL